MKAEIIAVGTELLIGQIANTNAQYLSEAMNRIGLDVYYHTVVGDNPGRIERAFQIAAGRSDFVIATGGLGPTQDDITKDVLAAYTGRSLSMDEAGLEKIAAFFRSRNQIMSDNNARQALTLSDADVLPNDNGMAVGVALTHQSVHWLLLPGPPREMKLMYDRYAESWIRSRLDDVRPLFSTTLKFSGIGESLLEKQLMDLIDQQSDPTIAPYAKDGEVAVRVSTKASSEAEADLIMAPVIEEIRLRVGEHLYATRDIPLEQAVVEWLQQTSKTVSVAESCTGGLLGELITSVPGSSQVFPGGVISYSATSKIELLGVDEDTIRSTGTVSAETAEQMAVGCRKRFATDWALAVTGVAGPGESEGKPPGVVYIAVAGGYGVRSYALKLAGDRDMIRLRAAKSVLYRLWQELHTISK